MLTEGELVVAIKPEEQGRVLARGDEEALLLMNLSGDFGCCWLFLDGTVVLAHLCTPFLACLPDLDGVASLGNWVVGEGEDEEVGDFPTVLPGLLVL